MQKTTLLGTITLSTLLAACEQSERTAAAAPTAPSGPRLTASYLTKSTLVGGGRATFEPFHVKRKPHRGESSVDIDIKAKDPVDIAVQTIEFPPGSYSGWHHHPGPVFISVISGTITFYEGDDPNCTPIRVSAGHGYLDTGDHPHFARNETSEPALNVVTYFAPPNAPGQAPTAGLRIDDTPAPGNCPF